MPQKQKTAHLQRATTNDAPTSQFSEDTEEAEAQTEAATTYAVSNSELRRSIANPQTLSPGTLMTIQRTYGNQAALRMIQRSQEQAQTTVQRVADAAQSPDQAELMSYVTDLSLIPFFKKYCEGEFSDENFLGFHAIRHYKKNPSIDQATKIYEQYIQPGAPKEGNFRGSGPTEVARILGSDEFEAKAGTIFDQIEEDLLAGLTDTFQRFKVSDDYKESKSPKAKLLAPINMLKGLYGKREGHMNKQPKGYKGQANI